MIYLFLIYSFYIINFSFIIKSECITLEDIEEKLKKLKSSRSNDYFNSIECKIEDCKSRLINQDICYSENQIKSIYGFEIIDGCYKDGDDQKYDCYKNFLCQDYLTELDSEGNYLGHLRCSRDYIDINDIDPDVNEKNTISQYKYDFKFNF